MPRKVVQGLPLCGTRENLAVVLCATKNDPHFREWLTPKSEKDPALGKLLGSFTDSYVQKQANKCRKEQFDKRKQCMYFCLITFTYQKHVNKYRLKQARFPLLFTEEQWTMTDSGKYHNTEFTES